VKKISLLAMLVFFVIFSGCEILNDIENGSIHETNGQIERVFEQNRARATGFTQVEEIPDFSVTRIDEEMLEHIPIFLEIDYARSRGGFVTDGITLMLNFEQPLTTFRLIGLESETNDIFTQTHVFFEVSKIPLGVPLILTNYAFNNDNISSGIYFETEQGRRYWYVLELRGRDSYIQWRTITINTQTESNEE